MSLISAKETNKDSDVAIVTNMPLKEPYDVYGSLRENKFKAFSKETGDEYLTSIAIEKMERRKVKAVNAYIHRFWTEKFYFIKHGVLPKVDKMAAMCCLPSGHMKVGYYSFIKLFSYAGKIIRR